MEMEDQATWKELTEQVMEAAPALENKSGLIMNGMDAFHERHGCLHHR